MDELLDLLDELVDALERRDGAEPDMASWDAARDVNRLERQLVAEYRIARNDLELETPAYVALVQ